MQTFLSKFLLRAKLLRLLNLWTGLGVHSSTHALKKFGRYLMSLFAQKLFFSQVINSSVYCRFNCLTKFFWYLIPFSFSTFLIKTLNTCPDPQHGQAIWGLCGVPFPSLAEKVTSQLPFVPRCMLGLQCTESLLLIFLKSVLGIQGYKKYGIQ